MGARSQHPPSNWALLHLPRVIALPLFRERSRGAATIRLDVPTIPDVVLAVAAIPVAWLLWKRRGAAAVYRKRGVLRRLDRR